MDALSLSTGTSTGKLTTVLSFVDRLTVDVGTFAYGIACITRADLITNRKYQLPVNNTFFISPVSVHTVYAYTQPYYGEQGESFAVGSIITNKTSILWNPQTYGGATCGFCGTIAIFV